MKQITLRRFTAHLQEFAEPVEVSVQIKGSGEITVLGTWTPARLLIGGVFPASTMTGRPVVSKPADAVRASSGPSFGHPSPAPRP